MKLRTEQIRTSKTLHIDQHKELKKNKKESNKKQDTASTTCKPVYYTYGRIIPKKHNKIT
jgi:hypothetical protein